MSLGLNALSKLRKMRQAWAKLMCTSTHARPVYPQKAYLQSNMLFDPLRPPKNPRITRKHTYYEHLFATDLIHIIQYFLGISILFALLIPKGFRSLIWSQASVINQNPAGRSHGDPCKPKPDVFFVCAKVTT